MIALTGPNRKCETAPEQQRDLTVATRRLLTAGVLTLAAVCLASCSCSEEKPTRMETIQHRQWVCESCGHTFNGPNVTGIQTCPKCNKQAAIRSYTYKCLKCGKYFEVYRFFDVADEKKPKGPDGKKVAPGIYFKKKGGGWVEDEEMAGEARCPHCGNANPGKMAPGVPPAKPEKKD